ncbi:hypothetical protein ACJJTC_011230, partial [Scirpophaga incertulas]
PICGGQCCGRGRETRLQASLRKAAERRFVANTKPITELLLSTRRTLQDHLIELSWQSQNKTAGFFLQLYRGHASRTHAPLASLYEDIRTLLRSTSEHHTEELVSRPPKDLADSSRKFFREVFPVAYQSVLKLEAKRFTSAYDECLKAAYDAVLPFGDIPEQMGSTLSHSLEAARVLLQVLAAGADALGASERALANSDEQCFARLMRVGGCARCKGHDVRPCRNYCLNVARGCIGSLVAELDAPWAGYVEGLERLTRPDADVALRELEGQVSKAIMYAIENHGVLESKHATRASDARLRDISITYSIRLSQKLFCMRPFSRSKTRAWREFNHNYNGDSRLDYRKACGSFLDYACVQPRGRQVTRGRCADLRPRALHAKQNCFLMTGQNCYQTI